MKESPFKITIDRQVIKLLGAHLYGDTPSVVNELMKFIINVNVGCLIESRQK